MSDTTGQQATEVTTDGATPPEDTDVTTTEDTSTDEPLGEAGLRALQRERQRARELEAKLKELENAQLSEAERIQRERDELAQEVARYRREAATSRAKDHIAAAAARAGATNPTLVARLVLADAEVDDDGTVDGLDDLINQLKSTAPELFPPRPGSADAGAGKNATVSDPNTALRQALLNR